MSDKPLEFSDGAKAAYKYLIEDMVCMLGDGGKTEEDTCRLLIELLEWRRLNPGREGFAHFHDHKREFKLILGKKEN